MDNGTSQSGLTLIETMIVVGVVIVLVAIVVAMAGHIDEQSKIRLMRGNFGTINAALQRFNQHGYHYEDLDKPGQKDPLLEFLQFPLDCCGLGDDELMKTFEYAFGIQEVSIINGVHDSNYSGSEGLYFFLSQVPGCKSILSRLESSAITAESTDGVLEIEVLELQEKYKMSLNRIVDPWGKSLRYDYYDYDKQTQTVPFSQTALEDIQDTLKVFPVISSAGPDGKFGTNDDITNK